MHTNSTVALKSNYSSSLLKIAVFFKYAFSSITVRISNLHNKDSKRFVFHMFGLKSVFILLCPVKAVHDDTSAKNIPI